MSKRFIAIIIAIILGLGVIFWVTSGQSSAPSNGPSSAQPSNHVSGQGKKGVTLVEYGDFQCPVCGAYYPTVKQVAAKYATDIYFQFRNLPLSSIHKNAFSAARAAEAAALQNKYWEMHDLLYEQQTQWAESNSAYTYFEGYAKQIGLDITKFKQDYESKTVNDIINADLAEFKKTGQQQSTPSFFINGKYVDNSKLVDANGYPSVDKFSEVINAEIAAQSQNK